MTTARELSMIIWQVFTNDEEFGPVRKADPAIRRVAQEMQAAALDAA